VPSLSSMPNLRIFYFWGFMQSASATTCWQLIAERFQKTARGFFFLVLGLLLLCPSRTAPLPVLEAFNSKVAPAHYRRIVSLAPSITEILFSLGLGSRVVGVTQHCDFPAAALTKPRVGSYVDLNLEKILSLKPDLIIATADGNERKAVERLDRFRVPVYITNPRNLEEVFQTILEIGRITRREGQARTLARDLRRRAERVMSMTAGLPRPRVFLQINEQPLMTVGRDTFHDNLIRLAGGVNVSGGEAIKYPQYSLEQVLRHKPDVIIITSMAREATAEKKKDRWKAWTHIPAVQQGRIFLLDTDLLDRPSPRLVDGLESLARAIHPELKDWK
jgi:iron complex transport system substrate-binding protein